MRTTTVLTVVAAVLFALSASAGAAADKDTIYKPERQTALLSAIAGLKSHIKGTTPLDNKQIGAHKLTIDSHSAIIGHNDTIIKACLDLVATYDDVSGPLWVARGGFNRRNVVTDIHWTIYNVMQHIMDRVYTNKNVARYGDVLNGYKFGGSAHFPGAVAPPADPAKTHTVKINGSYPKTFAHMVMHAERPARRPTGTYLAPGTIATVTVPRSLVGKGYLVRVGAHSWDMSRKPRVLRLDRSTVVYSIDSPNVKVANPLGGGIYIEVPYLASAGVVSVTIKNAVRSPYFSAKSFHKTSLDEWRNVERKHKAPWADFQSEKFMMQVPTSWIYKLEDPVTLMKNWDAAMDAMNDLMGRPHTGGQETMYPQVDLQLRASVFAPGYPSVNTRYDPKKDYGGNHNHHLIRGPQYAGSYEFHEKGHGFLFVKFPGERESAVNLPHVAVWNQKFGYSLDEALRASRGFNEIKFRTLDTTAITWMTSLNFADKKPMHAAEKAYQIKGHAKFVDIARLFGWKALGAFWHSLNVDYENGKPWRKDGSDVNKLILRLSQSAGADLTPLLHFWGIHPRDGKALKAATAAAKVPASAKIYDALLHYKSLVPADNKAFRAFASKWWGKQPSSKGYWTERGHAKQWEDYDEKTSALIKSTVQELLDLYFPGGRPRG